jgi:hypothetical protein
MRIRIGFFIGLAVGYYFGAKAGRERYEQLRRLIGNARGSAGVEKAGAVVQLGLQRFLQDPPTPASEVVSTRVVPN